MVKQFTFAVIVLAAVTACGGSGSAPSTPTLMYSIGGTVSGLDAGQSVVLQLNGGNDLTANANIAFTFATKVASGNAYTVTVLTPPVGKACLVNNGVGAAAANVTGVIVACMPNHTIGGTVSGLVGLRFKLALGYESGIYGHPYFVAVEELDIDKNGHFVFPAPSLRRDRPDTRS